MDHDLFWDLSWFEWSLYARRHRLSIQRMETIEECNWARFRIQWADFRNANTVNESDKVKPQDLITLSFDKQEEIKSEPQVSFKEMKERLGSKFKKDGVK